MSITPVPPYTRVPSRSSAPDVFSNDVEVFLSEINARVIAGNTQANELNALAEGVDEDAGAAAASASAAATSATNAGNSATAAANSATTATTKAGEASSSATAAATKAGEASSSATAAANSATAAANSATAAADSATAAADSATAAANSMPGTMAASTTSLAVATGTKSLVIQAGKAIALGASVIIARTAAPGTRMSGVVTAYDGSTGALTVDVTAVDGSGTYADWTVSLGGFDAAAATQAEMEAGTEAGVRSMSPLRVKQSVEAPARRLVGVRGAHVDLGAGTTIDLAAGNYFSKTITGTTTFTLSNVPASGTGITFSLELTNAGAHTVNFWSGIAKIGGAAITFTASGRDRLIFSTRDGGTTWDMAVLKDMK